MDNQKKREGTVERGEYQPLLEAGSRWSDLTREKIPKTGDAQFTSTSLSSYLKLIQLY